MDAKLAQRGPQIARKRIGTVDLIGARGNPLRTIGGLHQVIPWLTVMLATECIHQRE